MLKAQFTNHNELNDEAEKIIEKINSKTFYSTSPQHFKKGSYKININNINDNSNNNILNSIYKQEDQSSNLMVPYYQSEKWCNIMKNKISNLINKNYNNNKNEFTGFSFNPTYVSSFSHTFYPKNNNDNYLKSSNNYMDYFQGKTEPNEINSHNGLKNIKGKYTQTEPNFSNYQYENMNNKRLNNKESYKHYGKTFTNKINELQKFSLYKMFPKFRSRSNSNNFISFPNINYNQIENNLNINCNNICYNCGDNENLKKEFPKNPYNKTGINYFYLNSHNAEENKKSKTFYQLNSEIGIQALSPNKGNEKNIMKQRYIKYINKKSKRDYIQYYYYNFGKI